MKIAIVLTLFFSISSMAEVSGLIGGKPWTAKKAFLNKEYTGSISVLRFTPDENATCDMYAGEVHDMVLITFPDTNIAGEYRLCDRQGCLAGIIFEKKSSGNFMMEQGTLNIELNGTQAIGRINNGTYNSTFGYSVSGNFVAEVCE